MHLNSIDFAVIVVYLVGITAFGIWVGFRRHASTNQYFLASKSLGWFTVGAAVFTSNISTIHLVGLAAGGAKDGMVIGNFEWMACFTLILLALLFTPFYINSRVSTLPEFMERRYCPQARTILAFIGIIGALLIHIGISLFAAAKLFESFLGVPMLYTIVVLSAFTVTYTALGGLKAVVMTENIQVCLLLGGAVLITVLGLRALPAVGVHDVAAFKEALEARATEHAAPRDQRQRASERVFLAGGAAGLSDSRHLVLVRRPNPRAAGAGRQEPEGDGQNGAIFAGFLKITPVFLMVFPGVIGYVLWQKGRLPTSATCAGTNRVGLQHDAAVADQLPGPRGAQGIAGRQHGRGADELHGRRVEQLRHADLDGHRQAHGAQHGRYPRGDHRPDHNGRDHGAGHALVYARRSIRHDLRGHQQDPHDLRPGGDDGLRAGRDVETGHQASGNDHLVPGLARSASFTSCSTCRASAS